MTVLQEQSRPLDASGLRLLDDAIAASGTASKVGRPALIKVLEGMPVEERGHWLTRLAMAKPIKIAYSTAAMPTCRSASRPRMRSAIASAMRGPGVRVVNLDRLDVGGDFIDNDHLDAAGSRILAARLASELDAVRR